MEKNLVVAILVTIMHWMSTAGAGPPFTVTIDCGPTAYQPPLGAGARLGSPRAGVASNSLCDCIQKAFPKGVREGKFVMRDSAGDQLGDGATQLSVAVPPPKGFLPPRRPLGAPSPAGTSIPKYPGLAYTKAYPGLAFLEKRAGLYGIAGVLESETSAERLEKFQKGVQRMMHVVKVLGQVDQYLSDRTRIVVDKLSKVYLE